MWESLPGTSELSAWQFLRGEMKLLTPLGQPAQALSVCGQFSAKVKLEWFSQFSAKIKHPSSPRGTEALNLEGVMDWISVSPSECTY